MVSDETSFLKNNPTTESLNLKILFFLKSNGNSKILICHIKLIFKLPLIINIKMKSEI